MVDVIINLDHAIAMWIESLVLIVARNMQDMARDIPGKSGLQPEGQLRGRLWRCVVC
jgi:hypothetical protein